MTRAAIGLGEPVDVAELRWQWAQESVADNALSLHPSTEFVSQVASWMRSRTVWVARNKGLVTGMVCLTQHERMPSPSPQAAANWGYLGHLYVLPAARGQGIGRALVHMVLDEAVRRDYAKVVLTPSDLSVPLYRRCGFTNARTMMVWQP